MASQDYRRSQANARAMADLNRRLEETERGSPLRSGGVGAGGITVKGGSIRILQGGNLEVDGAASFAGDTAVGGELDVSGDAEFSGNLRVTGTLSLPAGIIDNDALASPAAFDCAGGGQVVTPSTSAQRAAVLSVAVPPGYTRAQVTAFGGASIPCTAGGYLYVGVQIGSVSPNYLWASGTAAQIVHVSGSATRKLTGLSGGTIQAAVSLYYVSGAWGAGTANADMSVIFLR